MKKYSKILFILCLFIACIGCSNNAELPEENVPKEETKEEAKTITGFALCDYIALEQTNIYENADLKSGVITTLKSGETCSVIEVIKEDSKTYRIWAKIESPETGWVCLKDSQSTYFMTETQYEQYNAPSEEYKEIVENGLNMIKDKYGDSKAELACIYAGYYPDEEDGAYQQYMIGYYSKESKNAYIGTYLLSQKYEITGFQDILKISHHFGGVCMAKTCPGEKNKTYESFGEVEAACINMRQAYYWDALYEKEEVDQALFLKNQEK